MQEPARVTIVDPARPEQEPGDVLGDDSPRSRHKLYAVLVLIALLIGWRGADTALERRAAAAQERRLQAVVDLQLINLESGGSENRSADIATVERQVGFRNAGPRPVEVLSASVGTLTFQGSSSVEPGRDLALSLGRSLSCAQRPADEPVEQTVQVSVRRADGIEVKRRLPLPPDAFVSDPALLRRVCGYLEPFEAGMVVGSGSVRLDDGSLLMDLLVANAGRAPLVLAGLSGGSGMGVSLHTVQGRPAALPVEVAPGAGSGDQPPIVVTVRLRVADCSAVVPLDLSTGAFDQSSAATLVTLFASPGNKPDPAHRGFMSLERSEAVADLLQLSCP